MSPFRAFVVKETRHILRDRQTLAVLLALPFTMVLLFGFAIRTDVENVAVVVVDPSRDARSAELTRAVASTPSLQLVAVLTSVAEVEPLLRAGDAEVALVLPTGFARGVARGTAEVLIVSDGINANYATTVETYVRRVVQAWVAEQEGGAPTVRVSTRMRFNPTLASENLFVPGLLAFVLTLVSALMTAISIAREKESGTMEVLLVSPLRPIQIVVGKVTPYLALAFLNAVTALGVAFVVFGVPVRGSVALLLAASLVYVLVSLALGVLIATRVPDQRTAMMGVLLGLLIPTLALTGFIFPIASMPGWLQPVTNVVPATWYIVVARGIMLKGVGVAVLWKPLLILCAMAVVLLAASTRALNDRIE
ncbi:ABC transporter permease [Rubrivirga sp. IMCC43871]|uniref:ABC transporter permease n=1 Tax=Rubrivirga sp. IMCC43871 TaxID=3391575 RepID=UPI0039901027